MPIDLRSDTVTHPTPAMRRAMYEAEVGDDVYGEDPTVRRLEELAAERVGKEASIFTTSGTQGNVIAMLTHCGRGDEIILGDQAHTFLSEAGAPAVLGGITSRPLRNQPDGTLKLDEIEAAIRPDNVHFPRTKLITVENTHNQCGGKVLPLTYLAQVHAIAERHGLRTHLDGARLFNAAIALDVPASAITQHLDTVQFCLSKGLSAPVGSMLAGPADFIHEAHRTRKILGGGMRQVGILAAAGIVALNEMVDRLAEDHVNARCLAEGLAQMPGVILDPALVQTNIVIFNLVPDLKPSEVVAELRREGVLVSAFYGGRIRAVTHYGITADDIETALLAFRRVLEPVRV